MSGHSKWSTIKHKKAVTDAKRANVFTRLAKDVTLAARDGGNPEMNYKLRLAMDRAKMANMPKDNIARAIKRGTGELKDSARIEEIIYEGYLSAGEAGGSGNVAMLIKVATDNKNRTLAEVKDILNKNNGKFVEGGGVSWQFELVGQFEVSKNDGTENDLEMQIIESGAKNYRLEGSSYVVFTDPGALQKVKNSLEKSGNKIENPMLTYVAKETIDVGDDEREKYDVLLEALEENDDVVEIYDNLK